MSKPYTYNFNAQRMAQIYIEVLRLLQLKRMSRNPKVSARDIAQVIGCDHRAISAAIATQAGINFHQLSWKDSQQRSSSTIGRSQILRLHCRRKSDSTVGFPRDNPFTTLFHRSFNMTPRQISPATPQQILRRCRRYPFYPFT